MVKLAAYNIIASLHSFLNSSLFRDGLRIFNQMVNVGYLLGKSNRYSIYSSTYPLPKFLLICHGSLFIFFLQWKCKVRKSILGAAYLPPPHDVKVDRRKNVKTELPDKNNYVQMDGWRKNYNQQNNSKRGWIKIWLNNSSHFSKFLCLYESITFVRERLHIFAKRYILG